MSGPIVRSGPTPEYSKKWDSVFGDKKSAKAEKPAASKKKEPAAKAKGKKKS